MLGVCSSCGRARPCFLQCSGCRRVQYCDAMCQHRHSAKHQAVCNVLSAAVPLNATKHTFQLEDFAVSASSIGAGNFSTVHRAVHRTTGTPVALKRISRKELKRLEIRAPNVRNEVLQEKALGAVMQHSSIPRLLGTFSETDALYFVYELVDGCELWDILTEAAVDGWVEPRVPIPLPPNAAALVITNIADVLSYMHGIGVVHRDVKPENIMIACEVPARHAQSTALREALVSSAAETRPAVRLALLDFGTAKDLMDSTFNNASTDFAGTPDYMSPEAVRGRITVATHQTQQSHPDNATIDDPNLRGKRVLRGAAAPPGSLVLDTRADLWSLGALAYHAIVGVPPFRSPSAYLTMHRIQTHDVECTTHVSLALEGSDRPVDQVLQLTPPPHPLLFPPGLPCAARNFVCSLLRHDPRCRLGAISDISEGGIRAGAHRHSVSAATSHPKHDDTGSSVHSSGCDAGDALLPPTATYINYTRVLRHSFLTNRRGGDDYYERLLPLARALSTVSLRDAYRALHVKLQFNAVAPQSQCRNQACPRIAGTTLLESIAALSALDRARLLHLLALRRRLSAPPVALMLASALTLQRRSAETMSTSCNITESLSVAVGAARTWRHVAAERRCCCLSRSSTPDHLRANVHDAFCERGKLDMCSLGDNGPREWLSWLVAPRRYETAGDMFCGSHLQDDHCGCDGSNTGSGELDSHLDSEARPTVVTVDRSSSQHSVSTAWHSVSGQQWSNDFSIVLLAHPCVSAAPVDANDYGANAAFRAALEAVASMDPPPRAIILIGHLTAATAYRRDDLTQIADSLALLRFIGTHLPLTFLAAVWLWGERAPATAEAMGMASFSIATCTSDYVESINSSQHDSALGAQLAHRSCAGWISGVRLLLLDGDIMKSQLPSHHPIDKGLFSPKVKESNGGHDSDAGQLPVGAVEHGHTGTSNDAASLQQQELTWLCNEIDNATASAQHTIVVMRSLSNGTSESLRFLSSSNVRAVIVPAPLRAVDSSGAFAASQGTESYPADLLVRVVPPVSCLLLDSRNSRATSNLATLHVSFEKVTFDSGE